MRLAIGATVRSGRAVDATDLPVTADAVLAAVRADTGVTTVRDGATADGGPTVVVDAPAPGPAHEHVGLLTDGLALSTRPALAAAARSRGLTAPQDDRIETLRERLATLDPEPVSTADTRRAVADAGAERDRLRERVAELRGRVRALEDEGLDATDARDELAEAVRELSEVETERVAADQRLDRARATAREARDARERRLELQDRLANREREARAHLADAVRPAYERALAAVPGDAAADAADATPVTAALAVARVADVRAPLVLACDRFRSPAAAADWFDAPVVAL